MEPAEFNDISSINECDINMGPSALREALNHESQTRNQLNQNSTNFPQMQSFQFEQIQERLQRFSVDIQDLQTNLQNNKEELE